MARRIPRPGGGRPRACAVALLAVAVAFGCGKKAPLRLPEDRPAQSARALRARVREQAVVLTFRVPARRVFPEREEPWVLARILRRTGEPGDFVEVGTVLDADGLAFDAELTWADEGRAPGTGLAYRVEFRDAQRRRRALTPPLAVAWDAVPGPPVALAAAGDEGAVSLGWEAPAGAAAGVRYRLYRRADEPGGETTSLEPQPPEGRTHVDTRIQPGKRYCYRVRALTVAAEVEVEGPPSEESCAATVDALPPAAPSGLRVTAAGAGYLLAWEPVVAPDLLGYRVYRAAGEGSFALLTAEPVGGTAWRDESAAPEPGGTLRWAVTAVDRSARRNESPFSVPATAAAAK